MDADPGLCSCEDPSKGVYHFAQSDWLTPFTQSALVTCTDCSGHRERDPRDLEAARTMLGTYHAQIPSHLFFFRRKFIIGANLLSQIRSQESEHSGDNSQFSTRCRPLWPQPIRGKAARRNHQRRRRPITQLALLFPSLALGRRSNFRRQRQPISSWQGKSRNGFPQ